MIGRSLEQPGDDIPGRVASAVGSTPYGVAIDVQFLESSQNCGNWAIRYYALSSNSIKLLCTSLVVGITSVMYLSVLRYGVNMDFVDFEG